MVVLICVLALSLVTLALYVAARRIRPRDARVRALGAALFGTVLLAAPAWLSVGAVMWAQQSHAGRRVLARLGLADDHDGRPTRAPVRLVAPSERHACDGAVPCAA